MCVKFYSQFYSNDLRSVLFIRCGIMCIELYGRKLTLTYCNTSPFLANTTVWRNATKKNLILRLHHNKCNIWLAFIFFYLFIFFVFIYNRLLLVVKKKSSEIMDDFWEDCENSGSAGRCSIHVPHSPSGKFLTYIWLRVHPFHAVNLCLCLSLRQVRLAAGWAQLFWNIQQQSETRPGC